MARDVSLDQLTDEIKKDLLALHKGIANESQIRIIDGAPVSTGALRASIRVGLNSEVVQYSPDDTDQEGGSTKAENESVIRNATDSDSIIITVGAPYGADVEGGTSEKAPTGFVGTVAESLDAIVEEVSKNLDKYR